MCCGYAIAGPWWCRRPATSTLVNPSLARDWRHAEVTYSGGRYQVRDVGSLNGTYVNRRRVEEAWLEGGDEVQIGKFKLVFMAGSAAAGIS